MHIHTSTRQEPPSRQATTRSYRRSRRWKGEHHTPTPRRGNSAVEPGWIPILSRLRKNRAVAAPPVGIWGYENMVPSVKRVTAPGTSLTARGVRRAGVSVRSRRLGGPMKGTGSAGPQGRQAVHRLARRLPEAQNAHSAHRSTDSRASPPA